MNFLISKAYAATGAAMPAAANLAAQDAKESFMNTALFTVVVMALFYVLFVIPQRNRYKKHRAMIDSLKKGDKVLTAGGLIGTVDKMVEGKDEVVVDLGNGIKVTALRSTIQSKED